MIDDFFDSIEDAIAYAIALMRDAHEFYRRKRLFENYICEDIKRKRELESRILEAQQSNKIIIELMNLSRDLESYFETLRQCREDALNKIIENLRQDLQPESSHSLG
ncbi:MAG: hypothetical protein H6R00_1160 [Proteobacteria bacterium]|nr:hypothetical protein [Pseudomonadota bacterium]